MQGRSCQDIDFRGRSEFRAFFQHVAYPKRLPRAKVDRYNNALVVSSIVCRTTSNHKPGDGIAYLAGIGIDDAVAR